MNKTVRESAIHAIDTRMGQFPRLVDNVRTEKEREGESVERAREGDGKIMATFPFDRCKHAKCKTMPSESMERKQGGNYRGLRKVV